MNKIINKLINIEYKKFLLNNKWDYYFNLNNWDMVNKIENELDKLYKIEKELKKDGK